MSHPVQAAHPASGSSLAARLLLRLAAPLLALLAAFWLAPSIAQAGTITIVDGPNTPPADGVYTDGYIQNYLTITGSLTISTTEVVTGPDDILMPSGAVIFWATGNTLTLDAGRSIVISGTIQQDGPSSGAGAGGVRLLVTGVPTGAVTIGTGDQTAGVMVGSRHGLTRVAAGNLTLTGASGMVNFAQLGFRAVNKDATYTVTGAISVTVGQNITATGGGAGYNYAQIGHGGAAPSFILFSSAGNVSGDIAVEAGGDVTFQGGGGSPAYVQLGHGGALTVGNYSGDVSLHAGGDVAFVADEVYAYAHLGHGGISAEGNHSGDLRLLAGGDLRFVGGGDGFAYAQFGHGGPGADGDHDGNLALTNAGSLTLTRGSGEDAYAMIGHGSDMRETPGVQGEGSRSGDISLRVGATGVFSGSQVGHLSESGVISVTQGNTLIGVSQNNPFTGGTGQLVVTSVTTPTGFSSAPTANGGQLRFYLPRADSQQTPLSATFNGESFAVTNTIPITQLAGFAPFGDGPYIPDFSFYLGGQPDVGIRKTAQQPGPLAPGQALTYTLSFSNTGTVTATGVVISDSLPSAVLFTQATVQVDGGVVVTQTGVAPNLAWLVAGLGPQRDGQIVVGTTVQNVAPSPTPSSPSAIAPVEVRSNFFTPDPITITVGSSVRWTRIEGFHNVVADDDSFTNGPASSSWTTFDQSFASAGSFPYHCEVHGGDGGIGMSGTVVVVAEPPSTSTFTNTATITATGDITLSNNSAAVARNLIAPASLTITKTVVGDPPGSAWQFNGSGVIGSFSLPAGGGSQSFSGLNATTYTITETAKAGYTSAVACTNGSSGTNSVQVTLTPGAAVACVFTNTEGSSGPTIQLRLPAIKVGP